MPEREPLRPPAGLTGRQRRHLRALAHHLSPIVQVGKEGLTEAVFDAVGRALEDHELIKVRVLESSPLGRREVATELPPRVGAHLAGQVGRVVILYRRHRKEPRITLPGMGRAAPERATG